MILGLRTDKPEAEIVLCNETAEVDRLVWQAHRELAESIHQKLDEYLRKNNIRYEELQGIIVYEGPGSFTGLRIGISVANALTDALALPIVGVSGDEWVTRGLKQLKAGHGKSRVMPEYGSPVHITLPKK